MANLLQGWLRLFLQRCQIGSKRALKSTSLTTTTQTTTIDTTHTSRGKEDVKVLIASEAVR